MDSKEYIEIVNMILDNALKTMAESIEKKLNFCMFYHDQEMHLVLRYPHNKEYSGRMSEKQ